MSFRPDFPLSGSISGPASALQRPGAGGKKFQPRFMPIPCRCSANSAPIPAPVDLRGPGSIVRALIPGNAGMRGCVRPTLQGLPGQQHQSRTGCDDQAHWSEVQDQPTPRRQPVGPRQESHQYQGLRTGRARPAAQEADGLRPAADGEAEA